MRQGDARSTKEALLVVGGAVGLVCSVLAVLSMLQVVDVPLVSVFQGALFGFVCAMFGALLCGVEKLCARRPS